MEKQLLLEVNVDHPTQSPSSMVALSRTQTGDYFLGLTTVTLPRAVASVVQSVSRGLSDGD